jgi:hypothetical protein
MHNSANTHFCIVHILVLADTSSEIYAQPISKTQPHARVHGPNLALADLNAYYPAQGAPLKLGFKVRKFQK